MKGLNYKYPIAIILIAIIVGFFFNYQAGLSWEDNLKNMLSQTKIITYLILLVVIFLWKNWKSITKN